MALVFVYEEVMPKNLFAKYQRDFCQHYKIISTEH